MKITIKQYALKKHCLLGRLFTIVALINQA